MKIKAIWLFLFVFNNMITSDSESWTWLHRKQFSEKEIAENKQKKKFIYSKTNLPLFTQLVFSWNGCRPQAGDFAFFVSVFDTNTNSWTDWYKMMEWGSQIQKSHKSSSDDPMSYVYVRLETNKHFANAFRIKIECSGDTTISMLKSFAVCLSNFCKFKAENVVYDLPSLHIKGVPVMSQFSINHDRNGGMCSPTSSAMLTSYLLQEYINPFSFAQQSYDSGLGVYGSWPFNMAHAYELCNQKFTFCVARLPSFKHLYAKLLQHIPVAVSVRGPLIGSASAYAAGHLLVVVGWDNESKEVICHDPAFDKETEVVKRYPIKDFLVAWERSRRLSYIADPLTNKCKSNN